MNKCPKCGTLYTDETLNYCLSDGTPLLAETSSDKTVKFSNPSAVNKTNDDLVNQTRTSDQQTVETVVLTNLPSEKSGTKKLLLIAISIFVGFIILSVGVIWQIYNLWLEDELVPKNQVQLSNSNANSNSRNSNANSLVFSENKNLKTDSENTIPVVKPTAITTPTVAETPANSNLFRIVGVRNNDVLYIRPQPGNLKVKVGSIPPNAKGIKVLRTKKVGKGRWALIKYNDLTGWVNSKFLAKE